MSNVTAVLKIYSDTKINRNKRKKLAHWLLLQRKHVLENGDLDAGQTVTRFALNRKLNRGRD